MHTAVKISPQYTGPVVYVLDASRSVPVVQSLLDAKNRVAFAEDIREQYAEMREVNLLFCSARAPPFDTSCKDNERP